MTRVVVDVLWPWVVSLVSLAVGIYFTFWTEAIQRDLITKVGDRSITASGERYVRSRAYRVVTRIIGLVSIVVGLVGLGVLIANIVLSP
jgi:hypothetical protein